MWRPSSRHSYGIIRETETGKGWAVRPSGRACNGVFACTAFCRSMPVISRGIIRLMLVVFTQNRKKSSEKLGETGGLCVIAMEKEQKLKKRLMKILVLAGLLMLSVAAEAQTSGMTIQQQIDWLQRTRQVHFVYDASLSLNKVYEGPSLLHLTTAGALKALFRDTGISYEQQGTYVMLKQRSTLQKTAAGDGPQHRKEAAMRTFTISGFVRDENGETLINATILDQTTGLGTMTNAYGFFCSRCLRANTGCAAAISASKTSA